MGERKKRTTEERGRKRGEEREKRESPSISTSLHLIAAKKEKTRPDARKGRGRKKRGRSGLILCHQRREEGTLQVPEKKKKRTRAANSSLIFLSCRRAEEEGRKRAKELKKCGKKEKKRGKRGGRSATPEPLGHFSPLLDNKHLTEKTRKKKKKNQEASIRRCCILF